jgi:uncharacterized RDD family membrane protein YckC
LTESTPAIEPLPPVRYATFTRRFRALVIDNALVWALALVLFYLGDAAASVQGSMRVTLLLMLALVLLYEPLLVSRRGATVGHAVTGMQVVDARTGRWPSFARSLARYLIKMVLGIPSFFTMALSRRHQAVHDMLTHTTVQVPATAGTVEFHVERVEERDVLLPSRLRRLVVIVVYLVAVFVVYAVSLALADTDGCVRDRSCSAGTRVLIQIIGLAWLGLSGAAIVAGWKGLLFGARRTKQVASEVVVA